MADQDTFFRVDGLTKHYPVKRDVRRLAGKPKVVHALDDFTLELTPGRTVAVVGESGSGKSTVARLMARLETPTAGRIVLAGKETQPRRRAAVRGYRREVQLTLQDPYASLNLLRTVAYILERPLRIHGMASGRAEIERRSIELLEQVHLTPAEQFLRKRPNELSGGQRQRVSIARALAVEPRILIADEPVSMLDVSVRLSVLNLFRELVVEKSLALVYITHDIASARYFADDIVVMYAGQILEAGPAEEVTQQPTHPYTQLLLSAAPDPEARRRGPRQRFAGTGEAPSLIDPPVGCRFRPRCPHAMESCLEQPPRRHVDPAHWAACWLLDPDEAEQSTQSPAPSAA
jgi:peptide/nickel transport system ATP-binding protein